MIKSKNFRQKWLPLVLMPLFSVAVLAGCSSDDDDDGGDAVNPTTPVVDPDAVTGDADGNGVPDAFQTAVAADDANGNGIADVFETPADPATAAADENGNAVDDSFEASLTAGADANADGVDDAAAATLAGGAAPDPDGTAPDPGATPEPVVVDQTGPLASVPVGEIATTAFSWDGFNLSGQVDVINAGVPLAGAGIYQGISAAGVSQPIVPLNGDGNPTFFVPSPVGPDQQTLIAENIVSGNLFVRVNLADGSQRDGIILLPGIQPSFTVLNAENAVPAGTAITTGRAFINVNTATGDTSAVLDVDLQATDVDADDNPVVISAVSIREGGPTENGVVIAELLDSGNGRTFTLTGVFSPEDLESVLSGNTYFSVTVQGDDSEFIRGQIPAF